MNDGMGSPAGDRMNDDVWAAPAAGGPVRGEVRLPGSKSLTNRALVLAALVDRPSSIEMPLRARDTTLMVEGLRALGAEIHDGVDGSWDITPRPLGGAPATVDCGLAGTVARFLPPLAALGSAPVRFDGDARMHERPLGPLLGALRILGATVDGDAVPATVRGPARGGTVTIDASASSQLVSGLLLAGAAFPEGLDLRHEGPTMPSAHHVAMTVTMLREHGVEVSAGPGRWQVAPGPLRARDRVIEPDLSSASVFLAAAAATGGEVRIASWPASSEQPGAELPWLLGAMGCRVARGADGGGLMVTGADHIIGLTTDLRDAPELALTLTALAVLAGSPSRLTGIAHLRLQETDRLAAVATELGKLGAHIEILDDGLAIMPAPLRAGDAVLDPHGDHRLAMAYAVVGLRVPGVRVADIATSAKTVPGFASMWEDLVAGRGVAEP